MNLISSTVDRSSWIKVVCHNCGMQKLYDDRDERQIFETCPECGQAVKWTFVCQFKKKGKKNLRDRRDSTPEAEQENAVVDPSEEGTD